MGTRKTKSGSVSAWRNRIVDHGFEEAEQLLANPRNWRIHPNEQQKALGRVLDKVGWIQEVIVNRSTGFVVDGHLRVALAISKGEKVPVAYVELTEQEEALILAAFDQITGMAVPDQELLSSLTASVAADFPDMADVLELMAKPDENNDATQTEDPLAGDESGQLKDQYQVLVDCASEFRQAELLERLTAEGWKCRALVS